MSAVNFLHYLRPLPDLEARAFQRAAVYLKIPDDQYEAIKAFLQPLKVKDRDTYDHCLRVGLLASQLTEFMHPDPKVGFYAGTLHDVGKAMTRLSTLQKTTGWTPADTEEIKGHIVDGYRLLRDRFDFTAEVILWHHRFQPNKYPDAIPEPLHPYCEGTRIMIPLFGRLLSLCDVFDAMHRVNDKFEGVPLTGEKIKELLLKGNPDQRCLIEEAYKAGIFTTEILEDK
jgi:putative nucleotidyltransferase with HDIG domain